MSHLEKQNVQAVRHRYTTAPNEGAHKSTIFWLPKTAICICPEY